MLSLSQMTMYYGEHGVVGFVGEAGESAFTTFKAPREAQTVVAGEGGGVQGTIEPELDPYLQFVLKRNVPPPDIRGRDVPRCVLSGPTHPIHQERTGYGSGYAPSLDRLRSWNLLLEENRGDWKPKPHQVTGAILPNVKYSTVT